MPIALQACGTLSEDDHSSQSYKQKASYGEALQAGNYTSREYSHERFYKEAILQAENILMRDSTRRQFFKQRTSYKEALQAANPTGRECPYTRLYKEALPRGSTTRLYNERPQ